MKFNPKGSIVTATYALLLLLALETLSASVDTQNRQLIDTSKPAIS